MDKYIIALAGNQNSGKTTLFNLLTGSKQHVGNFPGVTVEQKSGELLKWKDAKIVDLPGIYSLSPYSSEEVVTRDFIVKEKPNLIINIVDATNLERNLYLSLQLMELNCPMVLALNMMDEVESSGNSIDTNALSIELGIPVVAISASKNKGIDTLLATIKNVCKNPVQKLHIDFCEGEVHRALHAVAHIIEDHAQKNGVPMRFAATKLIEGDKIMQNELQIHDDDQKIIDSIVKTMESNLGTDKEAALADMRYTYIEKIAHICMQKYQDSNAQIRSIKLDKILTNKYLGIPIFIGIMGLIFYLTFTLIGGNLQGILEGWIESGGTHLSEQLANSGLASWIQSLIVDGIYNGVGSVLGFLPIVVTLFFFLSLLEDSGYMARVAFVMDTLLRKLGLSGKSFVPMLIGFGCSVPAIMATRTLNSERDRKMSIVLTPFMSCSAKLPIYGMITAAFFATNSTLVLISLYLLGIVVAIICALILKRSIFKGDTTPFVLELPAYRTPGMRSVMMHMWEKAKDFLKRAFTVIFIASILIWFLQSFNFQLSFVDNPADSILAYLGNLVTFIFEPLGFGDYRAVTALVTGLSAKESVVSTLSVLTQDIGLQEALHTIFTPLSAYAFIAFTLLYMPCFAAFAATKRELGSFKFAIYAVLFQTTVAYIVALLIYQVGTLLL